MNQWIGNFRRRGVFLRLAIVVGAVWLSGCTIDRTADRYLPWRTQTYQTREAKSIPIQPHAPGTAIAISRENTGERLAPVRSFESQPPIYEVTEPVVQMETEIVARPILPSLPIVENQSPSLPRPARAVLHADETTFAREVLEAEEPVLVDFYAKWCLPCQRLSPTLEEVAKESPHAKVVKVDFDKCPELASRYGVKSLPSLIVFKGGKAVRRETGLIEKNRLISMLDGFQSKSAQHDVKKELVFPKGKQAAQCSFDLESVLDLPQSEFGG
jgi:thioredoxin 1